MQSAVGWITLYRSAVLSGWTSTRV